MNFDDIRDQLSERFQSLWGRIQESSTYASLAERYQGLSPQGQRLAIFAGVVALVLLVLSFPYSYFSSSSSHLEEFQARRELTRDLLRVTRAGNQPPVEQINGSVLQTRVDSELRNFNLQEDQISGVQPVAPEAMKNLRLAPAPIQEEGLEVRLRKLNLEQLVDIGFRLQTLSEAVKMSGINVTANKEDQHYFDVTFQLASFSVPAAPVVPEKKGRK